MIEAIFAALVSLEVQCAPLAHIHKFLMERYDERRVGSGVHQGRLLEVWVSPAGTFTIVLVPADPRKNSCVIFTGSAYRPAPPAERRL